MATDPLTYTSGMTDAQRLLFSSQFNAQRKSTTTAVLLALLLGGVGAHHFYMGRIGLGILYVVLCWTLLPMLAALIEVFLMSGRVDRFNDSMALDVAAKVKVLGGVSAAAAT